MLPYMSPISTTWGTLLRFLIGHCNILVTLSLYAKKQVKISDKLFDRLPTFIGNFTVTLR